MMANEEISFHTWCCNSVLISPSWRSFSWEGLLIKAKTSTWGRTKCCNHIRHKNTSHKNTAWNHNVALTHWTSESFGTVFLSYPSIFLHNNIIIVSITIICFIILIVFTNFLFVLVLRFSFIIAVEMSTVSKWSPWITNIMTIYNKSGQCHAPQIKLPEWSQHVCFVHFLHHIPQSLTALLSQTVTWSIHMKTHLFVSKLGYSVQQTKGIFLYFPT